MPIKFTKASASAQPAQPEPSGFNKLRTWLGTGARIVGGMLPTTVMGGPLGAATGAGTELLAEALEGSLDLRTSPGRIGVEAGLSAIPLGRQLSAGRALLSAGKMGAMTGVGDLGRQLNEDVFGDGDGKYDWKQGLAATGGGAAVGGLLGRFFQGDKIAKPARYEGGLGDAVVETSGAVPRSGKKDFPETVPAQGRTPNASRTGQLHGPDVKPISPGQPATSMPPRVPIGVPEPAAKAPNYHSFEEDLLKTLSRNIDNLGDGYKAPLKDIDAAIADEATTFDRARRASGARDVNLAKTAKEDAKRALIQKRRQAAGVEGQTSFSSSVSSETPTGVKETMRTTFRKPKEAEGEESVEQLAQLLRPKSAEAAEQVAQAARGTNARTQHLLKNLDEEGLKTFNYYRDVEGLSDGSAYRKAFYDQGVRRARVTVPRERPAQPVAEAAEAAPTASAPAAALKKMLTPAQKETVQQSAHPSFYDDGFEALEDAAPAPFIGPRNPKGDTRFDPTTGEQILDDVAPAVAGPPPEAAAKLAQAAETYPPEVMAELTEASRIYNSAPKGSPERKAAGKELARLRDFMSGKGRYAPKTEAAPPAANTDWVAEQTKIADSLAALNPKGKRGIGRVEALLSAALGLGGGFAGAAVDASMGEDSWADGAVIGGFAGAGSAVVPSLLASIGKSTIDPDNAAEVKEAALQVARKLPQWQRFSLLANPAGIEQGMPALGANALGGPYGAALTTAIESIFKNDPRGWQLLKLAWNPGAFMKGMYNSKDEALEALVRGEGNRAGIDGPGIDPNSMVDSTMAIPGWMMTAGDVHARKLLRMAGYSDQEAKMATLTSEPMEKFLRRQAESGKGSWLGQMMFPFRRTLLNTVEQGAQRIPGVGFAMNRASGRDIGTTEALIEQGLGLGAGGAGYLTAANIKDDTTRRNVRRWVSNMSGRYSLPNQIGWAMGDAHARGNSASSALSNVQNLEQMFPLPQVEVFADVWRGGSDIVQGKADSVFDAVPDSMDLAGLRRLFGGLSPNTAKALDVEPERRRGIRFTVPKLPRNE